MDDWIQNYGTPALRRARAEGYSVTKGIAEEILQSLEDSITLGVVREWDDDEERTSPTAESFAKRDLVQTCVQMIPVPKGWAISVSRISRIQVEDEKFTGVFVMISDESHKLILRAGISFE